MEKLASDHTISNEYINNDILSPISYVSVDENIFEQSENNSLKSGKYYVNLSHVPNYSTKSNNLLKVVELSQSKRSMAKFLSPKKKFEKRKQERNQYEEEIRRDKESPRYVDLTYKTKIDIEEKTPRTSGSSGSDNDDIDDDEEEDNAKFIQSLTDMNEKKKKEKKKKLRKKLTLKEEILEMIKEDTKNIVYTCPYMKKIPPNGLLNLLNDEMINIKIITYNMKQKLPEFRDLERIVQPDIHHMYVVGTQECQTHYTRSIIDIHKTKWMNLLQSVMTLRYIPLATCTLLSTHLCIFIRKELKRYIRNVNVYAIPLGWKNYFGNNGATVISMIFGRTPILFINAHFQNGDNNVNIRNTQYHYVLKRIQHFRNQEEDRPIFKDFEHIFFFGDLNYRVNGNTACAAKLIEIGMLEVLRENDQLKISQKTKKAFHEFKENEIGFLPTYKFEKNTDIYKQSKEKQIVPSWTDRILYFTNGKIIPLSYESDFKMLQSDHRPVFGRFLLDIDATPLEPPEPDEDYEDTKLISKKRNLKAICKFF